MYSYLFKILTFKSLDLINNWSDIVFCVVFAVLFLRGLYITATAVVRTLPNP